MIRGTRILTKDGASNYTNLINSFKEYLIDRNYNEIIIPSIWEQETFVNKAGTEILEQMYCFKDKKERDICLIPEVTAIIQEEYNKEWVYTWKKPVRIFYVNRCYRYERPQAGRYREFTQFGVELLGGTTPSDKNEILDTAKGLINTTNIEFLFKPTVKRGLTYYVEDGFEIECPSLGAQKQVLGGGRYKEGIGFAIGIDRLLLVK